MFFRGSLRTGVLLNAFAPIIAALLFLGGCGILVVLGLMLAYLWREVQRGRVARVQADAQQEALDASSEALDEIEHRRQENRRVTQGFAAPPDADMIAGLLEERGVYTTDGNEEAQGDEAPSGDDYAIPADRMFAEAEEH